MVQSCHGGARRSGGVGEGVAGRTGAGDSSLTSGDGGAGDTLGYLKDMGEYEENGDSASLGTGG